MRVHLWLIFVSVVLLASVFYLGTDSLWKQIILAISAPLLLIQSLTVVECVVEKKSGEKKHIMIDRFNQYGLILFSFILFISVEWFIPSSFINALPIIKRILLHGSLVMTLIFSMRLLFTRFIGDCDSSD